MSEIVFSDSQNRLPYFTMISKTQNRQNIYKSNLGGMADVGTRGVLKRMVAQIRNDSGASLRVAESSRNMRRIQIKHAVIDCVQLFDGHLVCSQGPYKRIVRMRRAKPWKEHGCN
jgi:hypothetical protein